MSQIIPVIFYWKWAIKQFLANTEDIYESKVLNEMLKSLHQTSPQQEETPEMERSFSENLQLNTASNSSFRQYFLPRHKGNSTITFDFELSNQMNQTTSPTSATTSDPSTILSLPQSSVSAKTNLPDDIADAIADKVTQKLLIPLRTQLDQQKPGDQLANPNLLSLYLASTIQNNSSHHKRRRVDDQSDESSSDGE